jgi:protein-L-isoaspartate(D-aspartate) O-methyltransferase
MRSLVPTCIPPLAACILAAAALVSACSSPPDRADSVSQGKDRAMEREYMVSRQIEARGVKHPAVLKAMRKVERHHFVPDEEKPYAYEDRPLPIGKEQTISQPYIVALMTELLDPKPHHKVLEVGTGSGYQAAVLAEIVDQVYTIEIVESLGKHAETILRDLGYENVHVRIGDGYRGWPEEAPFDGIIVTAAPERVPRPLLDQLREKGRLVIPVGGFGDQRLQVYVKTADGIKQQDSIAVRFVPMTGEAMGK